MLYQPVSKLRHRIVLAVDAAWDSPDRAALAGWGALFVLLAVAGPLFVSMALEVDVTLYDIAARSVLEGRVLYRDLFDNNFPGIVWLHMAIRSLLGWSSEAIRLVDFALVAANVALLVSWMRMWRASAATRAWTGFALFASYLSTSEWCHCQRDVWMLVLAQMAAHLRLRQLERFLSGGVSSAAAFSHAAFEGLLWSAAVWIKPHVVIPAAAVWAASLLLWFRCGRPFSRLWIWDWLGLITAGLTVGAAGVAWLRMTGAWPSFLDVMLNWNPEYAFHGRSVGWRFLRIELFIERMWPWILVHAVAMPLAIVRLLHSGWSSSQPENERESLPAGLVLLSAMYVAWTLQAVCLQNLLDYIHLPPLLLGIAVIVGLWPRLLLPSATKIAIAAFVLVAALRHPVLQPQRLMLWRRCVQEGSTAEIRDQLSLTRRTAWADLQRVGDYLRDLQLRDGQLTCYNNPTHPLYLALNLRPSTRFVYLDNVMRCNAGHRDEIRRELAASEQRIVVSDLNVLGDAANLFDDDGRESEVAGELRQQFPWSQPVLFRSGRYAVHRVTGPFDCCWPEPFRRSETIQKKSNFAKSTHTHEVSAP